MTIRRDATNLAPTATVTVSASIGGFAAAAAVDGDVDTWWGSGDDAPQWIELRFPSPVIIHEVRLVASQDPAGMTTHVLTDGHGTALHTFDEVTGDLSVLSHAPDPPWVGVTVLRIETTASPSWVSWREIEVIGTADEQTSAVADLLFVNGSVVTVDPDRRVTEALAVAGDLILATGSTEAMMELAASNATVIDLKGRTVLPGIVDPHTHMLNDSWRMDLDPAQAMQVALENGITTLGNLFTPPEFLEEMRALAAAGDLRVRASFYLIATDNCGGLQGDWWLAHPPTRGWGEMFRIGGIKVFADGGSCEQPATREPLGTDPAGALFNTTEDLTDIVARADEAGFQVVMHAAGDLAVSQALDVFDAVAEAGNPLRHRIDHASWMTDEEIRRFGEVDVMAVLFGYQVICFDYDSLPPMWEETYRRYDELIAAHPELRVSWHGDDPWVGPISPLEEMWNAVTKHEVGEDGTLCEPPTWVEERALTVDQMLPMMTIDAAYALHRDEEVGSIEPGKLADLIVLSGDPTTVDPMSIRDIEVLVTLVGGSTEWCADPALGLCP